jgi:hypothetical protein
MFSGLDHFSTMFLRVEALMSLKFPSTFIGLRPFSFVIISLKPHPFKMNN